MKIFVTGGAGFIGSHIVEEHLKRGHEVWVIDNLSTGQLKNIEGFKNLRFDQAELVGYPKLKDAVEWADQVYHAAASLGMKNVVAYPVKTLRTNIDSTTVLLEAIGDSKKKPHLLFTSTSGVYCHLPLPLADGYHEDSDIIFHSGVYQQECYSLGKLVNEVMALGLADTKGFLCTVVRLFNTIGPRQTGKYGMVAPRFVQQALKGEPLTVYGDGLQSRAFNSVHDSVHVMMLLMEHKESSGQIYNVGNTRTTTILDLAKLIIERTKSCSKIQFVSYQEAFGFDFHDVMWRKPCLTKLHKLTNYEPHYTLEQTIDELIAFYHARLQLSSL